jgi:site-specific recombinase XerD
LRSPQAPAELGFKAHPHMLLQACGFALANKGHDTRALQGYLGHKNIQHPVRYTELAPNRFKDWLMVFIALVLIETIARLQRASKGS